MGIGNSMAGEPVNLLTEDYIDRISHPGCLVKAMLDLPETLQARKQKTIRVFKLHRNSIIMWPYFSPRKRENSNAYHTHSLLDVLLEVTSTEFVGIRHRDCERTYVKTSQLR